MIRSHQSTPSPEPFEKNQLNNIYYKETEDDNEPQFYGISPPRPESHGLSHPESKIEDE